ncbi:hypothetical protein BVG19_g796 [[Candida] boidinii]|nr:hypothetical protein BVG19_g796 [[Candida] boidinii]OWB50808.1 hypothetical protein B5S27_g2361 [[Candida] boidinii]
MNFSDIINSEILKKRKLIERTEELENTNSKKYFKTSDLLNLEHEEKTKESDLKEIQKRNKKLANLNTSSGKRESEDEIVRELKDEDKEEVVVESENVLRDLDDESLKKVQDRLRGLGQATRLYGEKDSDVSKRLEDFLNNRIQDLDSPGAVKLDENGIDKVKSVGKNERNGGQNKEEVKSKDKVESEGTEKQPVFPKDQTFLINKDDIRDNIDAVGIQCRDYIRYLLKEWDDKNSRIQDLNAKDNEDLRLTETKKWLLSLLVGLKKQNITKDLLITLSTIFYNMQQKEFIQANENYIKLSVGNIAWPIGVINVGIHSRSADSKITGESNISNIMKDEKTRRWILGVKRLITFAESSEN